METKELLEKAFKELESMKEEISKDSGYSIKDECVELKCILDGDKIVKNYEVKISIKKNNRTKPQGVKIR